MLAFTCTGVFCIGDQIFDNRMLFLIALIFGVSGDDNSDATDGLGVRGD